MKKHLLILALCCLGAIASKAQVIPNPGFEIWADDAAGAKEPNTGGGIGWQCLNDFSSPFIGGSPITVFKDSTTVHSGSYSARIVTADMSKSYSYYKAYFPHDTTGLIVTGVIAGTAIKTGIPCTNRIVSFSFFYQYAPVGTDTASCSIVLYKFNKTTKVRNAIGAGIFKTGTAIASWTPATVTLFYDSSAATFPDTVVIAFSSSSLFHKPQIGSTFIIDDASVVAGIDNINAPAVSVNVYPSPATAYVNFQVTSQSTSSVARADIYDITGQKVNSYGMHNNFLTMSTQGYAAGLYFYQLYDKNGELLKSGKFSIAGK